MDEEEQVVGVVKFCDICGEKTVHVDGVCRDHKIVRRRKQAVADVADDDEAVAAPAPRPRPSPTAPKKKKRKKKNRIARVFAFLVLVALLVGMGMFHVVYGGSGIELCRKAGFSFTKTFVNIDTERAARKPDVELLRWLSTCVPAK
ncbi:hypothetical protein BH11MYX2_BH11MYX2_09550 [soil metagenome]